jgi:hypothetical protein
MQRPTCRPDQSGALAQLVERCLCKAEVRGSNPLGSTTKTRRLSGISYLLRSGTNKVGAHILPTIAS